MKNVFLAGKLNTVLKSIYYSLTDEYYVQMTSDIPEVVSGMLNIVRPDVIVVCLVDMDESGFAMFEEITGNYKTVPVIVIGSKEEIENAAGYINEGQFHVMIRPVTTAQIKQEVKRNAYVYSGEPQTASEEAEVAPVNEEENRQTILVVDDSAIQLRAMRGILKEKYKVEIAKTGDAVKKIVERVIPDMIFLDYDMPGQDGKEIFEMLQEYEPTRGVPVVFLTGVRDRERIQAVLTLNPAGYMLKPVEQDKIFKVADEILSRKSGEEYNPVVVSEDVL